LVFNLRHKIKTCKNKNCKINTLLAHETSLMPKSNRAVIYWLLIVCFTVFCMIVVGGITRLTDSGLSMVEWRPLIGIIPPIGEVEWQSVFTAYKNYPQYQTVNQGIDLEAFKSIFYWEYGHRVLGRMIGIIFFLPFVILLALKKVPENMVGRLWVGLLLGGLQGLMGWYMVKSGLVDIPRVSHFRLAAHFILALAILAYLTWLILDLWEAERFTNVSSSFRGLVYILSVVLFFQFLYGAFVAGSRAGYGYNTFPLMNGEFMPDIVWQLNPLWLNWVENNAMLQFVHRWLGAMVLFLTTVIAALALRHNDSVLRFWVSILVLGVFVQFTLGVFTLLQVVPIGLASLHQAGGCFVLIVLVCIFYKARSVEHSQ